MSNLQRRVYDNSPIFLQNIITSVEGYRKNRNRYGNTYYSFLIELESRQHSNETEVKRNQEQELRGLIQYAVEKSPFYKEFYKGIDMSKIQTIKDLKKLPVLDKEILQQHIDSIYTISESAAVVSHVSSNPGIPLKFLFTKEDIQKREAFLDFFKKQHGALNLEMKRASFSSRRLIPQHQQNKVFWRDNHYIKQRVYSSFYCTEENAAAFVADLEKYKPDFIDGLPSAIYEIAKFINKNNIILSFKPVAIFPVAEILSPHYRGEIEKAFECPLREQYTSPEGAPFITECIKGRMHYNLNSGVIETNEEGEMIVTSFNTYGTPLIRYNIGDQAQLPKTEELCECGSVHPVFEKIYARTSEYLQSKSKGKLTSVYFSAIGKNFPTAIQKMQFIQNSADTIEIFIEGTDSYTNAITEAIHEMMKYMFGEDMTIHIRIVEQIPNLSNKKFQPVLNNLMQKP